MVENCIHTCCECKRWKKSMRKYNKKNNKRKDECNKYGLCKMSAKTVEWDNYICDHFRKSRLLSFIQWVYKHFGIVL